MDNIIKGIEISDKINKKIKIKVDKILKEYNIRPGISMITVGKDQASISYIKYKTKIAKNCGFYYQNYELDENTSTKKIIDIINELNKNKMIHGIIVQLPLPNNINKEKILQSISYNKDIDGFNCTNIGNIVLNNNKNNFFVPCTPAGIMFIIKNFIGNDLSGFHAVVVGRSNIVGKPIAFMLLNKNATITVAHSKTKNLSNIINNADILISAIGKTNIIKPNWIKNNSIVIDVGINRISSIKNNNKKNIIVGDIEYKRVLKKVKYITPVPGGVGPMTISMLMYNTLKSLCNVINISINELI